MCSQNRNRRQTARPTGTCRWLDGAAEAREAILGGRPALLEIVVRRQSGEYAGYYFVSAQQDGWVVTRQEADGSFAETYFVSRDCWTCTCEAYRRDGSRCKHTVGVRAALARLGF